MKEINETMCSVDNSVDVSQVNASSETPIMAYPGSQPIYPQFYRFTCSDKEAPGVQTSRCKHLTPSDDKEVQRFPFTMDQGCTFPDRINTNVIYTLDLAVIRMKPCYSKRYDHYKC